jgi:hypothetical protein
LEMNSKMQLKVFRSLVLTVLLLREDKFYGRKGSVSFLSNLAEIGRKRISRRERCVESGWQSHCCFNQVTPYFG